MPLSTIYEHIERAIKVGREMFLDRQYVVRDGEIVIVDEFTGRLGEGRKWRAGIHQAVEAKEGVEDHVRHESGRADHRAGFLPALRTPGRHDGHRRHERRRTAQDLQMPRRCRFRRTGRRFGRSCRRWSSAPPTTNGKRSSKTWSSSTQLGRPVLVGTRSIDKSEVLSRLLEERGIEHKVLNARHVAAEAEIVAHAGERGKVTVATNMAGRGTDVRLGEGVAELGGLHVICTELHEAQRIDRQLIGRCGRQGDPGTYRQFLALDDEILETAFGPKKADKLKARGESYAGRGQISGFESLFYKAQRKGRAPPLPRPQDFALPRKRAPKNAAADEPGSVSGYGRLAQQAVACPLLFARQRETR